MTVRDWLLPDDGLKPVSREAMIGWAVFYALFLYAATGFGGVRLLHPANLMFHEAGHAVFGWAGYYTVILGGTLGQLLVPLICTLIFIKRGETTAVALCGVWTFENFLDIAAYMGDARRSALPLVGGDESDWTILFTHWGVLGYDTRIAAVMSGIGWIGMLASVVWLVWMHLARVEAADPYRRSYTRT
jgi:hypothetical protein